jgi:argininosuccinate synthase
MKKIILAYSGGLDTSCCIRWLKDRGYDVVAFLADLGQEKDFSVLKKRALQSGASKVYIRDLKDEFIEDYILPALKANALYESKYLLATALSRPLIAKNLVDIAHTEKAGFVAHGCTGKGNDQVRIELGVNMLDPELEIIAPLRLWELKSRDDEIKYALKNNIPIDVRKGQPYSIDKNLWGVSVECGVLEDPGKEPPQDAFQVTHPPEETPDEPRYIDIYFKAGSPWKINKRSYSPGKLIERLNKIGSLYGIGRTDLIEDRLVGIKSREIYEAPAAWILHSAHKELESLVLDRELLHFKELVGLKYAQLIYYGLAFSPLKKALDKFVDSTQERVTGTVTLKLFKGSLIPTRRRSPYSLYKKKLATYGPQDEFDQRLAEGFIKIWSMPYGKVA